MFKSFVMSKKGFGNIEFRQYDDGHLTVYMNKVETPMDRERMIDFKKAYIANGWTVKAEKKAEKKPEKKVAAPRQKWHFPNGFDRGEYIETARQMGYAVWKCGDEERIHASKEAKRQIYLAMGAYYA